MVLRISQVFFCLISLSFPTIAKQNATVTEDLFAYLLAGPSTEFRIIGSLKAGEPVTATGNVRGKYSEVTDERGRTGWLATDNLSKEESFRTRLPDLTQQLGKAQKQLATVTEERDQLLQINQDANEQANAKLSELLQQTQESSQIIAQLKQQNEQLSQKVTELSQQERFIWLRQGGMIAGIGLLLGLIVAHIPKPKRKRRYDGWA